MLISRWRSELDGPKCIFYFVKLHKYWLIPRMPAELLFETTVDASNMSLYVNDL